MNAFTPATYASICRRVVVRQVIPRAARGAAEADRPQESVLRDGGRAEDFRQPAVSDAPLELHLPEAILRVDVAEAEQPVELVRGEDVRDRVGVAHDVDGAVSPATVASAS